MKQKKYLSIALIYLLFMPKYLFAASSTGLAPTKYGFLFDQSMINTAYSEDQKSFQKKTHKVVQFLSKKIKETNHQAKSIKEIIDHLARKRKKMAYADSVTNDLDRRFFDARVKKFGEPLCSHTGLHTFLLNGTRKEAKNKFLEKLKDKNYLENFIRLKTLINMK